MRFLLINMTIIFLISAVFPNASFAQKINSPEKSLTTIEQSKNTPKAPENIEEAKTLGKKFLSGVPDVFKKSLEELLFVWKKVFKWLKTFWDSHINPWFQKLWDKILCSFRKEVNTREPKVKKEFQKEKNEMKEDIPRVGKSIWQRFVELVQ